MDAATLTVVSVILSAFLGASIKMVQMTVSAERRRADDWKDTAETSAETTRVLVESVDKLILAVDQLSVSQRELMVSQKILQRDLQTSQREVITLLRSSNPRGSGG